MTVFNLMNFPNVCRLCMKTECSSLYPINGSFEQITMRVETFLDEVTFRIAEDKMIYLPKFVCDVCLDQLTEFAVYRKRLILIHRFMEALVDLKHSKTEPLEVLFRDSKDELNTLFNELSLCNKVEPSVEDILQEFESYNFAKLEIFIKEEIKCKSLQEETIEEYFDYQCPEGSDLETKPEVYSSEEANYNPDFKESSSEDDRPLKKRKNPKAKSTKIKSPDSRPRGRPKIYSDGIYLPEPWSCDKCDFKTKYRLTIDRHKAVHEKRENRIYSCPDCKLVCKTKEELRSHHSSMHPQSLATKRAMCEVCGLSLKNSYSLKVHMERHGETAKYACEYCDYTSLTRLAFKSHLLFHKSDNLKKKCEVCGLSFRTASRLTRHMEQHRNERKYSCPQCSARFNTKNTLRNHTTRVHLAIRHPCEHCEKTFDQKIALRDHTERVHHIQSTFICDICVATFDSQGKLNIHQMRHGNPKPLECSVCLSIYTTQDTFDDHLCITYREDYMCCNKDLRNHAQYNRHMLIKHGIKTNMRVKPIPGVLLGQLRGARKRLEQCRKCDIAFPSRALKLQHLIECNRQPELKTGNSDVKIAY
ncbi:zinc finger protein 425-like [Armigeres subalbatus]|uniref:zinc finger protein 425-like n=1 Tax=Armigeres subalbatus TaxID=124917 RepID=UPI002ED1DD3B